MIDYSAKVFYGKLTAEIQHFTSYDHLLQIIQNNSKWSKILKYSSYDILVEYKPKDLRISTMVVLVMELFKIFYRIFNKYIDY